MNTKYTKYEARKDDVPGRSVLCYKQCNQEHREESGTRSMEVHWVQTGAVPPLSRPLPCWVMTFLSGMHFGRQAVSDMLQGIPLRKQ
jgi:hypothetical protein